MNNQPFTEPAAPILRGDPALSDEQRADLFDIFHDSKDENELAQHLQTLAVPDDTKAQLFDAKKKSSSMGGPVDKATAAITRLGQIDPKILDLAESHPKVTAALVGAATKEATGEPSGAGASAGKGKTQAGAAKLPPLAQEPRPDGLEHLPPIPDSHYRVLASDGGLHDIPADRIEDARNTDPRLHVLNP